MESIFGTRKEWVLIFGTAVVGLGFTGLAIWLFQADNVTPAVNAAANKIDGAVKSQGTEVSSSVENASAKINATVKSQGTAISATIENAAAKTIAADNARHEQTRTEIKQTYLKPLINEGRVPETDGNIVRNPSTQDIRIWYAEFKPDMSRPKKSGGIGAVDPEYLIHFSNKNYNKETGSYRTPIKDLVVPAGKTALVVPVITIPEASNSQTHGKLILYYGETDLKLAKSLVIDYQWYDIKK